MRLIPNSFYHSSSTRYYTIMYDFLGPLLLRGTLSKIINGTILAWNYTLSNFIDLFILTLATINCGFGFKQYTSLLLDNNIKST